MTLTIDGHDVDLSMPEGQRVVDILDALDEALEKLPEQTSRLPVVDVD